jgi:hypothetical protein
MHDPIADGKPAGLTSAARLDRERVRRCVALAVTLRHSFEVVESGKGPLRAAHTLLIELRMLRRRTEAQP